MSRYANDPRVATHPGPSYTVTCDGQKYRVVHTDIFGWTICRTPGLEFLVLHAHPDGTVSSSDLAINLPDADTAIGLLIGEPA